MRALSAKQALISVALALGLLTAGYAALIEPRRPRLTRRTIRLARLPRSLSGLTILHLSDLHVAANDPTLGRFLEKLSSLEVDMVAMTGDFIESEQGIAACAEMVGGLRGRHGVYAVMGNHDHFTYPVWSALLGVFRYRKLMPTQRVTDALESHGITVLNNESRRLVMREEVVQLVGIDDTFSKADDLPKATADLDAKGLKVLLSHSPDILDEASGLGFDLVLSGHTHGGQVRLPLIGALTTHTAKPLRPASGVICRKSTAMHVSQGLGTTGLPVRFLCPPEATVLSLESP